MSNLLQAAQQALDVLENDVMQRTYSGGVRITDAAIALRTALAEPEQEPVIWADLNEDGEVIRFRYYSDGNPNEVALYEARTA